MMNHFKNISLAFLLSTTFFVEGVEEKNIPVSIEKLTVNLDDLELIEFINKNHVSFRQLGWGIERIEKLLQQHGSKLEYLSVYRLNQDEVVKLVALCPNLTHLIAIECYVDADNAAIIAHSNLAKLKVLDLSNSFLRDEGTIAIATNLSSLESLNLTSNYISCQGMAAIVANLPNLIELDLTFNFVLENMDFSQMTFNLPHLKKLSFVGNHLTDRNGIIMAQSLTTLEKLDLSQNDLTQDTVQAIATHLTKLTSLNLTYNEVGREGGEYLANGNLSNLSELYLAYSKMHKEGVVAIGKSKKLPKLTTLDLSINGITDITLHDFAIEMKDSQLRRLYLEWNQLSDMGALVIAVNLPQLTVLDVQHNYDIGNRGIYEIISALKEVEELYLSQTGITNEGVVVLCSTELPKLTRLELKYNDLGDAAAAALVESRSHPNLKHLDVQYNLITPEGIKRLDKIKNRVNILHD